MPNSKDLVGVRGARFTDTAVCYVSYDSVEDALAAMTDFGLSSKQVQDPIPVQPLADLQPTLLDGYRAKLPGVMEKIRPWPAGNSNNDAAVSLATIALR